MMENKERIWLITGVSGGLGRALALAAAQAGNRVIGTLRHEDQLEEFSNLSPGRTIPVLLDVTDHAAIDQTINDIIEEHGRIDVLVNNAGYGHFGAIEEVGMEEVRRQMETNFFGALAMTQAVLPGMRARSSGHIVQISSMAGMRSNPGMGIYNASKFALEGFSEALAHETAPLGIRVLIVEPGPFRTNWAGGSASKSATAIEAYAGTAGKLIETVQGYSGKQPNDPEKAAEIILKVMDREDAPLRLPLGPEAINAIRSKLQSVEGDIKAVEDLAIKTAFDAN